VDVIPRKAIRLTDEDWAIIWGTSGNPTPARAVVWCDAVKGDRRDSALMLNLMRSRKFLGQMPYGSRVRRAILAYQAEKRR
jgi:hypothetical protein